VENISDYLQIFSRHVKLCMERPYAINDNWLAKIAKNGNQIPTSLQNVDAKVGHRHHERTGTLDKIQDMVL